MNKPMQPWHRLMALAIGSMVFAVFTVAFAFLMYGGLKAIGRLRVNPEADRIGIDAYEHGASVWPDVYAMPAAGVAIAEAEKNHNQTPEINALESE